MTIYIDAVDDAGVPTVRHPWCGYTGALSDDGLAIAPDDPSYVFVRCPKCGSESAHPIAGGACDEDVIQQVAARALYGAPGRRSREQAGKAISERAAVLRGSRAGEEP